MLRFPYYRFDSILVRNAGCMHSPNSHSEIHTLIWQLSLLRSAIIAVKREPYLVHYRRQALFTKLSHVWKSCFVAKYRGGQDWRFHVSTMNGEEHDEFKLSPPPPTNLTPSLLKPCDISFQVFTIISPFLKMMRLLFWIRKRESMIYLYVIWNFYDFPFPGDIYEAVKTSI